MDLDLNQKLWKFGITIVEITLLQKERIFAIHSNFEANTINNSYDDYNQVYDPENGRSKDDVNIRVMKNADNKRLYNINMAGEPMLEKPVKEEELHKHLENIDDLINKALIKYYNRYQLKWLMDHNYSLRDLIDSMHPTNDIEEAYENIYRDGINGEIFLIYDEWCEQIAGINKYPINTENLIRERNNDNDNYYTSIS